MENNKKTIQELLNGDILRAKFLNNPNIIIQALLLTIIDNQALILAKLQIKSTEAMRDYMSVSFQSQLEILGIES